MPTYIANKNIYRLKRYGDMAIWLNGLCSKKGEWVTGLDRTRYPSDFYDYKSTGRANNRIHRGTGTLAETPSDCPT